MTDARKFGELSDAEKAALLLAAHNGEEIEYSKLFGGWRSADGPYFHDNLAYRVRPRHVTDAPKRIWVCTTDVEPHSAGQAHISIGVDGDATPYIRADLVPQWQPIETAPKDGEELLLCCRYVVDGEDHSVFWVDLWYDGWWLRYPKIVFTPAQPTHWMPLPPAPGEAE